MQLKIRYDFFNHVKQLVLPNINHKIKSATPITTSASTTYTSRIDEARLENDRSEVKVEAPEPLPLEVLFYTKNYMEYNQNDIDLPYTRQALAFNNFFLRHGKLILRLDLPDRDRRDKNVVLQAKEKAWIPRFTLANNFL
jgi:hypothetical protein